MSIQTDKSILKTIKKASAKILHNNYLQTTAEKVQKFKDNNLWDESDTAFNLANKYFI